MIGDFIWRFKCVTHVLGEVALFTDAPTSRGKRQLIELSKLLRSGYKAGLVFSVQRSDAAFIRPNYEVNMDFASLLKAAVEDGLKIFTLKVIFTLGEGVTIWPNKIPFTF
ncbi:MAG: DNA/RNA nuclease SfsA [Candidatus Bathyarchaeia archaeon]